jgi:hypothetical protein
MMMAEVSLDEPGPVDYVAAGFPAGASSFAAEVAAELDYSEVSPVLQQVRGPYPIADGITAYVMHVRLDHRPARAASMARRPMLADRR